MITTIKSDRKKAVTIGIYIILLTIVSTTHTLAQHFQLNGNNAGNTLFQSAPKVGLGTTNPNAYFHISNNLNDYPIFKIDGNDPISGFIGYFNFFGQIESIQYGLYQKGILPNYFEGDIGCKSSLTFDGQNSSIEIKNLENGFNFHYQISLPGARISAPLRINYGGITVEELMECNKIQIHNNAGEMKVLVSDADGVGTWSDANVFNDQDWLETTTTHSDETGPPPGLVQKSLFANPRYGNIGIGTDEPLSKLHIVDGNVLISRSACKAPESINGSLLFGEVVSGSWPLGEWGIEYERLEEDYYSGGLNFWKVASAYNAGADNCLFLRNNGNIGVGTSTPHDKFQISRGFEKLVFGSMVESFDAGTAYIGFNSARLRGTGNSWLFDTDGSLNGGCITLGDLHGNYHIVTLPSNGRKNEPQRLENEKLPVQIRMTVTGQGDVGIGTTNTHGYKLAVLGRILCTNLKVQLEQDWPDYVFRDNYPLMPLSELEQYITLNNRLPGIPSSEEIKNNGIDVSNMQVLLVRKIEELTRYILGQQKILAQQQQQIEKLIMLQKNR